MAEATLVHCNTQAEVQQALSDSAGEFLNIRLDSIIEVEPLSSPGGGAVILSGSGGLSWRDYGGSWEQGRQNGIAFNERTGPVLITGPKFLHCNTGGNCIKFIDCERWDINHCRFSDIGTLTLAPEAEDRWGTSAIQSTSGRGKIVANEFDWLATGTKLTHCCYLNADHVLIAGNILRAVGTVWDLQNCARATLYNNTYAMTPYYDEVLEGYVSGWVCYGADQCTISAHNETICGKTNLWMYSILTEGSDINNNDFTAAKFDNESQICFIDNGFITRESWQDDFGFDRNSDWRF